MPLPSFDPNNKQPRAAEWATFVPDRKPKFKTYVDRGHALNAFQYRDNAILYKWSAKSGEWVEVFREEDVGAGYMRRTCEKCRAEDKYVSRIWVRKAGKIVEPFRRIWACSNCERLMRDNVV